MRILVKGGVFKNTDTRLPAHGMPAGGLQAHHGLTCLPVLCECVAGPARPAALAEAAPAREAHRMRSSRPP